MALFVIFLHLLSLYMSAAAMWMLHRDHDAEAHVAAAAAIAFWIAATILFFNVYPEIAK
jgi:hypothetical protein